MSQITLGSVAILFILFLAASCTQMPKSTISATPVQGVEESIFMEDVRTLLSKTENLSETVSVKPVEI